ncbi:class I SAM-dependent methyltransferase [Dehalococcoidia bacterium]|nr:class I SAM-dependent methyltransferase [Dehalococcoidia bacterium]
MSTEHIKRAVRAGWDAMSESYQRQSLIAQDDVHYAPFTPGEREMKLLGPVSGKRVLELAYGAAQNSIALSRWGANVVALDISSTQLAHALKLKNGEDTKVELVRGDMERPSMFSPCSFDIALSSFGWEFVPDLENCLRECHRLLKANGLLIISTTHPLSAFEWDERERAVLVTDYFSPPVEVWTDPVPEGHDPAVTIFRTFQEMFELITEAGFRVERVLEPYPEPLPHESSPQARGSPYAGDYWEKTRERLLKVPFAIVYVARRES